jgi:two-component system sensor histidine kinase YesM
MIIPTVIIFLMFLFFILMRVNSELVIQGDNSLSGVKTNFDVVVRDAVYQQSLMTSDNNMLLQLRRVFTSSDDPDGSKRIFLNDYGSMMRSVVYSHSYIDSIYIYLNGYNNFFSSTENGAASLDNYYDSDWYTYYANSSKEHDQWIVRRTVDRFPGKNPVTLLTVFQRTSSSNGVIVININSEKLMNMLNTIVTDRNQYFYMLDSKYNVILSDRGSEGPGTALKNGYIAQYLNKNKASLSSINGKWIKIGGRHYLAAVSDYPESQINLVSLISSGAIFAQLNKFLLDFLLILISDCIIVFFLAYITTKRNFEQIDYMIQVFSEAEKGRITEPSQRKEQDEYDLVMNNVIRIFLSNNEMNRQLVERQHQLEVAELRALQLQINPHFLLNTLQTIDFEARSPGGDRSSISSIIEDLSDILKYALGNPLETVSLRDELEYLKEYVNIQRYRFGDKFIVYYEIGDGLEDCRVFRLMLQPLIENSISHGVRTLKKTGYIKLRIYERSGYLHFRVIDNGVGMTPDETRALIKQINDAESRSIGLTNVNRRLILEHGADCGLHIRSRKNFGMCVSFKIPFMKQ